MPQYLAVKHIDCRTQEILQTVVFVGPVPHAIEDELKAVARKPRHSAALAKHFGAKYETALHIGTKKDGGVQGGSIWGGAESESLIVPSDGVEQAAYDARIEYDIHINEEISEADYSGARELGTHTVEDLEVLGTENNENLDAVDTTAPMNPDAHQGTMADFDLGVELGSQPITIDEQEIQQAEEDQETPLMVLDVTRRTHKITYTNVGHTQFLVDYTVGPHDNIMDLKKKIFAATGIPVYRQHLFIRSAGKNYPMYYKLYQNKQAISIDIGDLIEYFGDREKGNATGRASSASAAGSVVAMQEIEGCPINLALYRSRDTQHISALDTFALVTEQCKLFGTSVFYVADLNDIIEPAKIHAAIAKDKFAIDMFYYGFVRLYFPMISAAAFTMYLRNEADMHSVYPELALRQNSCVSTAKLETKLTMAAAEASEDRDLEALMHTSITQTMISIMGFYPDREIGVHLRNLFDALALDHTVCYARAHLLYENRPIILRKSYYNEQEPRDTNPLNTLLIKIRTNPDTNENIRMLIYKNGNYYVRTEWREETHMNFERIAQVTSQHVNRVVAQINKLGRAVFYYDFQLPTIDKYNAQFTESSMVIYFEDDTTEAKWQMLQKILGSYQSAEILNQKESISGALEFFFRKGMFAYDAERIEKLVSLENYYEYLSNVVVKQKWATLFERTRLMEITQQTNRVKITVNGLRNDSEIDAFLMYTSGLLRAYHTTSRAMRTTAADSIRTKTTKTLKNLKQLDPILYDFKKIYKSPVIYSKICQRPYQPLLLNKREYEALPRTAKDRAVKYWNFTTQSAAYYSCPNPKYPFIKFIIKQHPKDYCIPCCKKIMMHDRVNPKKQTIHNECLEKFKYTGERVSLTKGSHYIASYGKVIEVGRIARLPEHTLEPLFFDTYSPDGGIDQECTTMDGYYLVGVDQNTPTMKSVGMLFVVAHALQTDTAQWLATVAAELRAAPSKFKALMNGRASMYFSGATDLADQLSRIYDDQLFASRYEQVPWNELIAELAFYFSGVNVIKFMDTGHENIHLQLPAGLKTADEMFPPSHKCVVVISTLRTSHYYPVYLLNTELYKRTGIIDQRLFVNESGIITMIKAVVRKHFESSHYDQLRKSIDLSAVYEFAKAAGMTVRALYTNQANLAYAAILTDARASKGPEYYFPCQPSHYVERPHLEIRTRPMASLDALVDVNRFMIMISNYNEWVISQRKKILDQNIEENATTVRETRDTHDVRLAIYPEIKPTQLIGIVRRPEIIGFIAGDMHFYFGPHKKSLPKPLADLQIRRMRYDPLTINQVVTSHEQCAVGQFLPEIADQMELATYSMYFYRILLNLIITLIDERRNVATRTTLLRKIRETNFDTQAEAFQTYLRTQIKDPDDMQKINKLLARFLVGGRNFKKLNAELAEQHFNFDRQFLDEIRGREHTIIKKKLLTLVGTHVSVEAKLVAKGFQFPNMIGACAKGSELSFCRDSKLRCTSTMLNDALEIIASELTDENKWKWLLNVNYLDKVHRYMQFVRRAGEHITIMFIA